MSSSAALNVRKLRNQATPDGTSASVVQAAIDSMYGNSGAGTLILDRSRTYDFSGVTVKPNVTVQGPYAFVGSPQDNAAAPYGSIGGAITVDSAATVTLKGGAGLDGCLVRRAGATFPVASSAAFAGTAITAGGDDCFVTHSMLLAFAQAYTSNGYQRPRIQSTYLDCQAGILVVNCADVTRISDAHAWPFAGIAYAGKPANWADRSGAAYKFTTLGDWNKLRGLFSYGYFRGFDLQAVNSMTLESCSTDGTAAYAGSIGFALTSGCTDTRLNHCQAAAQSTGYYLNTTANLHTRMIGCDDWYCFSHGMQVDGGDFLRLGGTSRNTPNGITINSTTARGVIDYMRFRDISGNPVNMAVTSRLIQLGEHNDGSNFTASLVGGAGSLLLQQIASGAAITVPQFGDSFEITGTTDIGTINGMSPGRKVRFYNSGALTYLHSTGSRTALRCNSAANFAVTAGGGAEFFDNGVQIQQIGGNA